MLPVAEKTVVDGTFVDGVIRAASLDSLPGVYFLGPYSFRLSFVSQQHRALNLVAALLHTGKVIAGSSVGLVGAGLTGIMAASTLVRLGCSVSLYETHSDVLARQRNATHRYVHPSINFWPLEPLNPTTDLPFFDWYAGRAADVVQSIEAEWKASHSSQMSQLCLGKKVTSLQSLNGRVVIVYGNASQQREHDLAVVATGFEEEDGLPGSAARSYWEPDGLDVRRDTGSGCIWVSGLGDGGVIDALRLVHHEFQSGKLVSH